MPTSNEETDTNEWESKRMKVKANYRSFSLMIWKQVHSLCWFGNSVDVRLPTWIDANESAYSPAAQYVGIRMYRYSQLVVKVTSPVTHAVVYNRTTNYSSAIGLHPLGIISQFPVHLFIYLPRCRFPGSARWFVSLGFDSPVSTRWPFKFLAILNSTFRIKKRNLLCIICLFTLILNMFRALRYMFLV